MKTTDQMIADLNAFRLRAGEKPFIAWTGSIDHLVKIHAYWTKKSKSLPCQPKNEKGVFITAE